MRLDYAMHYAINPGLFTPLFVREQLAFRAFLVYLEPKERRDLKVAKVHQDLLDQLVGQV